MADSRGQDSASAQRAPAHRWRAALLLCSLLAAAAPAAAKRIALVIGNDSYQHVTALKNARSDAKAVAEVLKSTGFTVIVKQDLTLEAMKEALRNFKAQIAGGDDAVFYYSGHGVQFAGTNYLIPIDILPQNEDQVADDAVPLQRVLDDLQDQKTKFALAIVDACRNNPFKSSGRAIGGRGLAPVSAATGQMVLYSAGAGQEALDNLGPKDSDPNGVFTRVLIKEMVKPGLPAEQVLKRVRDQVVALAQGANHDQVPAVYDQSIGEFYFVPGNAAGAASTVAPTTVTAPTAPSVHVESAAELEQSFWDRIKDSRDPADFEQYAKQFPNGPHTAEAGLMLRKLKSAPAAPTQVASVKPSAGSVSPGGQGADARAAPAQSQFDGQWAGSYNYGTGGNNRVVQFAMVLKADGARVFGRILEPNTFGGNAKQLNANLQGSLQGGNVMFTKTYDGSGGYSQSVQYSGVLSRDGGSITGTWELRSGNQVSRGNWEAHKAVRQ
ncbi:MAG: caspase family protein [Steroidobacteraceae bacterium]